MIDFVEGFAVQLFSYSIIQLFVNEKVISSISVWSFLRRYEY